MNKFIIALLSFAFLVVSSCQNTSPSYKNDTASITKGKEIFDQQCTSCHNFKDNGIGPNLSGITSTMDYQWFVSFIQNPQAVIDSHDERATLLFGQFKTVMPAFSHLPKDQIENILAYINTYKKTTLKKKSEDLGQFLEDPIPKTIKKSKHELALKFLTQAPATSKKSPLARINKMGPLSKNSNRVFISDLNGVLYEKKESHLEVVLKIRDYFENFISKPGLGTGLGSFAFHPEYATNGLFYTTHTELADATKKSDFTYHDSIPKEVKWILTEWKQHKTDQTPFEGVKRELLSVDMNTRIHGLQEISFNPIAKKGNPDYGMLYITVGDGRSAQNGFLELTQSISKIWGSILRIDPLGSNSKNGHYGIPTDNPYVNIAGATGEIWAYGFRNPNRISWDIENGNLLASDIGNRHIEEINIIKPGLNYGWPQREGTFKLYPKIDSDHIYKNDEINTNKFTAPVLQFDHDDSNAICGGFTYYGNKLPSLQGKYIFGSIVHGKIYIANATEFNLGTQTEIEEVEIRFENKKTDLKEMTNNKRVDLRLGLDGDGELYVLTKADGKIYEISDVNQ